MPLRKGKENVSWNIDELMRTWEKTGMINGDKIPTKKEAQRRAVAIALSYARQKKD